MITKLAKAKDNWFFKILSAAVAVSFISLFGVTGYISSATQNQTVIKIGKKKISQSEFSYRFNKEANALKNLAGDDFELTDEMRANLIENVTKQIVDENVLDLAMTTYNIHFPKALVQQVILHQPEFQNPLNGQFHPELFKRYLSAIGMSEAEYVATVERAMGRKLLVTDLVQTFAIPSVLSKAIHKMDNQRKSFKYTVVSPKDMKVERKISDDEIQQYFEDFGENLMVDEQREVKVMYIPNEVILKKYAASDEQIEDYFNQHKKELDQPEKREILQMVFMNKETAEQALQEILNGKDFNTVAEELKAENAKEPTLGVVAEDELAEDLSAPAFEMQAGEAKVLQVADTWQVIAIKEIVPAKEAKFDEVKDQIAKNLSDENMYEALREARANIDDAINGGKSLEEVAKENGAQVFEVKGVFEEQLVKDMPEAAKDLASTLDFNEMVYSYGLDEISSAEEFDNGIAVVQITKIVDAHMPEIEDVKDEIVALWTVQEKDALAKETADNIVADVEDGSELTAAAKARDLEAFRSAPISRNETFGNLTPAEINELFTAENGTIKVFEHTGNTFIIASPFETVNYQDELTEDTLKEVQNRAASYMFADMSDAALNALASDYKIKIDYKRIGFAE